jgi:hypothetical protein
MNQLRHPATAYGMQALHHAMFAVDIVGFGTRDDASVQLHLREAMYRIVERACDAAGLRWSVCYHEDRGDGLFVIAPPCISAERVVDGVVPYIRGALQEHNKLASEIATIQLRVSVHAGYVRFDGNGASGHALIHLFRLLDAVEFKTALRANAGELGLLVSGHLYDEVVRQGPRLIDSGAYRHVSITNKETDTGAWLWLPPPPLASAPTLLTRLQQRRRDDIA